MWNVACVGFQVIYLYQAMILDLADVCVSSILLQQGYSYGFLTTLEVTWLLMCHRSEPTILHISMGFNRNGVEPSVAQALYWLIHQVDTNLVWTQTFALTLILAWTQTFALTLMYRCEPFI